MSTYRKDPDFSMKMKFKYIHDSLFGEERLNTVIYNIWK